MAAQTASMVWFLVFVLLCVYYCCDAKAPKPPKMLHWDSTMLPFKGKVQDTHVVNLHTVAKDGGMPYLVRAVERITPRSGKMKWRLKIEGPGCSVGLGVVASMNRDVMTGSPTVWDTYGDGTDWSYGLSKKININFEHENRPTHTFTHGDTVVVSFDPITKLLAFELENIPYWRTVRSLAGAGLDDVQPCVWTGALTAKTMSITVLSREGVSQQELDIAGPQMDGAEELDGGFSIFKLCGFILISSGILLFVLKRVN